MPESETGGRLLAQLKVVLDAYERAKQETGSGSLGGLSLHDAERLGAMARSAVYRAGGSHGTYADQVADIVSDTRFYGGQIASRLCGVAASLKADIEAGYLDTFGELVHGEVFGDYLGMASHLVDESYKDAAAVIAGSTLEAHLRQLCAKAGVPTEHSTKDGPRPNKADTMNADLVKAGVYEKGDQKNVTAWLDLRNHAAHGEYKKYEPGQVGLMIDGIRDFITRNPA